MLIIFDIKDPLPVVHRPLMVYAGTSLLCPMVSYKAVLVVFQLESKQNISKTLERLIVSCHRALSAFQRLFVLMSFCCSNVALAGDAMVPWTYRSSMSCGREGCDRGKSSSLLIRLGPGISHMFHILNYKPVLLLGGKCKGCCNQKLQMWHIELHINTVIGIAMTTRHPACQRLRTDPRLGFHRERAGGLCYWKRSRQNVAGNLDLAAPRWTQHSDVWGKGSGSLWRWLRWRAVFFEDGCAEWVRNIFLVSHFFCLAHTFWSLQKKNQGLSLEIHDNRLLNHHAASLHVTGRCRWSLSMA